MAVVRKADVEGRCSLTGRDVEQSVVGERADARERTPCEPGRSGVLGEVGGAVPAGAYAVEVPVVLREAEVRCREAPPRPEREQFVSGRNAPEVSDQLLEHVEPAHASSVSSPSATAAWLRAVGTETVTTFTGEECSAVARGRLCAPQLL